MKKLIPSLGKTPPSPKFETLMAQLLAAALSKHLKIRKLNLPEWIKEFIILHKNHSEEEITQTLEWYILHLKDEYTPKAHSASSFRKKFDQIREAMKRDATSIPEVEVTPLAEKLHRLLEIRNWPHQEGKQVLQFIQTSINNYDDFNQAIKQLYHKSHLESTRKTKERKDGRISTADWRFTKLLENLIFMMPSHSQVIDIFLENVNFMAWNYPAWRGNILPYVFKADSERFQLIMSRLVAEYRGDGEDWVGVWDQIKPMLKNVNAVPGDPDKQSVPSTV